jgi:hypothetical protein
VRVRERLTVVPLRRVAVVLFVPWPAVVVIERVRPAAPVDVPVRVTVPSPLLV